MITNLQICNILKPQIEKHYKKCKALADYITNHPEVSGKEAEACRAL